MPSTILIAGGGPAAFEAALTFRELAPGLAVELLCPDAELVYRPLSVVEPFARAGVRRYPVESLERVGVKLRPGRLAAVDPGARSAVLEGGEQVSYDALLLATGVRYAPAVGNAITFTGVESVEAMHGLVQDVEGGYSRRVAFHAPPGAGWTLPLYELALQTAERAREMSMDLEVVLSTHEREPLGVFGPSAVDLVASLLDQSGIAFRTETGPPEADRVIALGVPRPPVIAGLPEGFLAVDDFGAVAGAEGVWAAGDVTDRPIRQGGLAAQQAAVGARAIAAALGAGVAPETYAPVLRALLYAGRRAYFLRRRLDGADLGQASSRALWWPPSKIAGERLAPFLDGLDAGHPSLERRTTEGRVQRRIVVAPERSGPLG